MVSGAVTVLVVDATADAVDTALTSLRVSGNDKYAMASIQNGQKILIAHIEEV